jgi:hypothetical protein
MRLGSITKVTSLASFDVRNGGTLVDLPDPVGAFSKMRHPGTAAFTKVSRISSMGSDISGKKKSIFLLEPEIFSQVVFARNGIVDDFIRCPLQNDSTIVDQAGAIDDR